MKNPYLRVLGSFFVLASAIFYSLNSHAHTRSSSAMNPAISTIIQGVYAPISDDVSAPLPGFFHYDSPAHPVSNSVDLLFSGDIDEYFYSETNLDVHVEGEEARFHLKDAFVESVALGKGLKLKVGRFAPALGRFNQTHDYFWDFAQAPLANDVFFGGQLFDQGARLSWTAPTPLFLELSLESHEGKSTGPLSAKSGNLPDAFIGSLFLSGNAGLSKSWELAYYHVFNTTRERDLNIDTTSTIHSRLSTHILHFQIQKYFIRHRQPRLFTLSSEWILRNETGTQHESNQAYEFESQQLGGHIQVSVTRNESMRMSGRFDFLYADNRYRNTPVEIPNGLKDTDYIPRRVSWMVEYRFSDTSLTRLQYTRDKSREQTDHQVFLELEFSLGPHGIRKRAF